MKKKRPTPRQMPSGRWICEYSVQGKRYSVTDDDPDVCQAKAVAMQAGLIAQAEAKDEDKDGGPTLTEAIDSWITDYEKKHKKELALPTIRGYRIIQRNRFEDLMPIPIKSITTDMVQASVDKMADRYASKTLKNSMGLLRTVLSAYGVQIGKIGIPDKLVIKKKESLQLKDIQAFLAEAENDPFGLGIIMGLWLGMRRSEICGLCWDCVDEEHRQILVRRAYVINEHNQWELVPRTKTETGKRDIACPDFIFDRILAIGRVEGEEKRVFEVHPTSFSKHVHIICEKIGLSKDISLHSLRHTNAAVMRYLQIPDNAAMERGGWKDEQTYKRTYSYVFGEAASEADQRIDAFFTAQRAGIVDLGLDLGFSLTDDETVIVDCESFPEITGEGPTEDGALKDFCFNLYEYIKLFCADERAARLIPKIFSLRSAKDLKKSLKPKNTD